MVYICKRCGKVFKSWRSYIAHILIAKEHSYTKSSRYGPRKRIKAIKRQRKP